VWSRSARFKPLSFLSPVFTGDLKKNVDCSQDRILNYLSTLKLRNLEKDFLNLIKT